MNPPEHVLRAVEEQGALNAFYHATKTSLPVGETVEHWGAMEGDDPVDRLRPMRVRRPRWGHFFLTEEPKCLPALGRDDPDLDLYEVTPQAPIGPLNWGWLKNMSAMSPWRLDDRNRARRYWAGVRKPDEPCLNEYLAEAVHVDRYLGKLGEHLPKGDKR